MVAVHRTVASTPTIVVSAGGTGTGTERSAITGVRLAIRGTRPGNRVEGPARSVSWTLVFMSRRAETLPNSQGGPEWLTWHANWSS
jgi:hypothetical protein